MTIDDSDKTKVGPEAHRSSRFSTHLGLIGHASIPDGLDKLTGSSATGSSATGSSADGSSADGSIQRNSLNEQELVASMRPLPFGDGEAPNRVSDKRPLARFSRLALSSKAMGGMALAAALAAALWTHSFDRFGVKDDPTWTVKGKTEFRLFVKRGDVVTSWQEGTSLRSGESVEVRVNAGGAGTALLGVTNRRGRLLLTEAWMMEHRLTMEAGEKRNFQNALTLDDANEGETLHVVFCSEKGSAPLNIELIAAAMVNAQLPPTLNECQLQSWSLRP